VCNKTEIKKPNGFIKYIEYDENLCYSDRWTKNILPEINSKYILILHDVQIIIKYDEYFISNIITLMQKHNIDRISLNVFDGVDVINDYNIKICNLNNAVGNTTIPYDNCPCIWNKESFRVLLDSFPNETYRTSELNNNLQIFCREKMRCYGLQKTNKKIYYCLGRPFLENFCVLFITIKNELLGPIEVYMDMKDDFLYYLNKYKLSDRINFNNNYDFILNQYRTI
jgi:hypothetical protein